MRFIQEFERIAESLSELAREGREINYSDGAIGITELISCPKKVKLRRQYPELSASSVAIDDGFFFEKAVKEVLKRLYGDRFEEEKVLKKNLQIDGQELKIEGHLDCFIDYDDETVVAIELKNTVMSFDNQTVGRPEGLIIVDDDRNVSVNYKYILQARIQKSILEEMYPDKKVESYLFIKSSVRTKTKVGKSLIVYPVKDSISEDYLIEIGRQFLTDERPRAGWECSYCIYKEHGLCDGHEEHNDFLEQDNGEQIRELLERLSDLESEKGMLVEQLKNLINGSLEWRGKQVGWLEVERIDWTPESKLKVFETIRSRNDWLDFISFNTRKLKRACPEALSQVEVKRGKRFVV